MQVRPAEGVTLRDTLSGATASVAGAAGDELTVGEFIVARLLPVGEDLRLGGPIIPVAERLRPSVEMLAGDATADACAWAEWIGSSHPSQSEDGDGEPPVRQDSSHHHHHHDRGSTPPG